MFVFNYTMFVTNFHEYAEVFISYLIIYDNLR